MEDPYCAPGTPAGTPCKLVNCVGPSRVARYSPSENCYEPKFHFQGFLVYETESVVVTERDQCWCDENTTNPTQCHAEACLISDLPSGANPCDLPAVWGSTTHECQSQPSDFTLVLLVYGEFCQCSPNGKW